MQTFYLKRGDTLPVLQATCLDSAGVPHDLSQVASVNLNIKLADGTEVTRPMTIYSATEGLVRYAWAATDWTSSPYLTVGIHSMEYEAIGNDSSRLTFPNNSNDTLIITDDLG